MLCQGFSNIQVTDIKSKFIQSFTQLQFFLYNIRGAHDNAHAGHKRALEVDVRQAHAAFLAPPTFRVLLSRRSLQNGPRDEGGRDHPARNN